MIRRTLLALTPLLIVVPAFAQTDPATSPPAAADAPKPYVPPANTGAGTQVPPTSVAPADTSGADPEAGRAAETLPTQIEDVQIVGPWTDGNASGIWRTVMMQTGQAGKDAYRFFIQKLDRVGPGAKLLATTEIKEIAGVNGSVVGYRADEPEEAKGDDLTLFFDIVPAGSEIPETYELRFPNNQPYTFGPASN